MTGRVPAGGAAAAAVDLVVVPAVGVVPVVRVVHAVPAVGRAAVVDLVVSAVVTGVTARENVDPPDVTSQRPVRGGWSRARLVASVAATALAHVQAAGRAVVPVADPADAVRGHLHAVPVVARAVARAAARAAAVDLAAVDRVVVVAAPVVLAARLVSAVPVAAAMRAAVRLAVALLAVRLVSAVPRALVVAVLLAAAREVVAVVAPAVLEAVVLVEAALAVPVAAVVVPAVAVPGGAAPPVPTRVRPLAPGETPRAGRSADTDLRTVTVSRARRARRRGPLRLAAAGLQEFT
ncbi:MAG: hypothetical protein ABUS79_03770 [Pseudomonadota bacterium]